MKFKNRAANILWIVLVCWSGIIHALSNPNDGAKPTVYPSVLYPGKVWTTSPPAENTLQHNNIWQNNDVNTSRYRPLEEEEAPQIPQTRSTTGEYCVPKSSSVPPPYFESDQPTRPRYRSEFDDAPEMPRYRSETNHESYQQDNRYRQRAPRREQDRLPPQFSPSYWQSRSERFYDNDFFAMPYRPTWEMSDPLFSEDFLAYPPLSPDDWNPYMRNNFSSKNASPSPPTQQTQVPVKNDRLPPSAELNISPDWIPAPNSALVDSEEFTTNYAETQVPAHSNEDNVAVGEIIKP